MSCELPKVVLEYLELLECSVCNREQKAMGTYIRRVFQEEDLYVDTELLERYLSLEKYFPFALFPWEKFLLCLWDCTYKKATMRPRWKTLFVMVGRGAGKDGFIAFDGLCSLSPYNPVKYYDVDICANNEEQAVRPLLDLVDVLETPKWESKLRQHFYHTKETVKGRKNKGKMTGHTNNPKGRDGLRSGKVIFNEVHQYENYDNITVFTTGLGKKAQPRVGYFTSNGKVADGPLDDFLARGRRILFEGEDDKGFLPFICCLDNKEQVHDPKNWAMANPSLNYLPDLAAEIAEEYESWLLNPEENRDFLTKRMGIRSANDDMMVTDYEKIRATNKPLIDLSKQYCTVGIDYAELNDWASVNFHFRLGDRRYDINHSWICARSKDLPRIKAPWQDWVDLGVVEVVNEETINPELLCEYIAELGKNYAIKMLALDHHRYTLFEYALKKIGYAGSDKTKVKLVRPSDIMKTVPVISYCFDNDLFIWGNNPALRWACNNTKRVRASRGIGSDTGNFYYAKIEARSRKTDPFMALVHSMCVENELNGAMTTLPRLRTCVLN